MNSMNRFEEWLHFVNVEPCGSIDWKTARDEYGYSLLHAATHIGLLEYVQFALSKGVEANVRTKCGNTPLHNLALCTNPKAKYAEILKLLVGAGANINAVNHEGRSPYFFAVYEGKSKEHLQQLEQFGAVWRNVTEKSGYSVVHFAVLQNNLDALIYFLSNGADVSARSSDGTTPLILAASTEVMSESIIKTLVEYGADINEEDNKGFNAMNYAITTKKSSQDFKLLISLDPTWDWKTKGRTLIHYLARTGNADALKWFIEEEESVDIHVRDKRGLTLIHSSAVYPGEEGFLETVNLLVNHGLDINALTVCHECNVLFLAIQSRKSTEKIEKLLELGVDWTLRDKCGFGVLHHAAASDNLDVFKLFLSKGADVSNVDNKGRSLLHIVKKYAKKNASEMIKLLEENEQATMTSDGAL